MTILYYAITAWFLIGLGVSLYNIYLVRKEDGYIRVGSTVTGVIAGTLFGLITAYVVFDQWGFLDKKIFVKK